MPGEMKIERKSFNERHGKFIVMISLVLTAAGLIGDMIRRSNAEMEVLRTQVESLMGKNVRLEAQVVSNRIMANDVGVLMKLNGELFDVAKDKMNGKQIAETSAKIIEMSKLHADVGITIPLICGMIDTESGWDPKATSYVEAKDGRMVPLARGLMQMVYSTARPYVERDGFTGVDMLHDPVWSVQWGTTHLVDLHKQFMSEGLEDTDDFHVSVMAYFWGERLAKQAMDAPSSGRSSFPALGYWKRVRESEMRWREKGF